MTLRIRPFQFVAAALAWTAMSAVSGFVASRWVIDAEMRSTDARIRRTTEDLERYGLAMAQHVLQTTRAIDEKIDVVGAGKEPRK